jgi:hypothetical protein
VHQNKKAIDGRALTDVKPSYNQDNGLTWNSNAARFDFAKIGIQPRLKVSQPGDEYEQEADKVVEQVMRTPMSDSSKQITAVKEGEVDRQCVHCDAELEKNQKMKISRKPSNTFNLQASEQVTTEISNIRSSGGFPLDSNTKGFMESRFGYDFSEVKIHSDERAARSSNSVNALAYTVGNHIVFGGGQYQPYTLEGRRLLAHELTHYVQQSGSDGRRLIDQNNQMHNLSAISGPVVGKRGVWESIQRAPQLMDPVDEIRFNSLYNQVTGAYTFLTQQQLLAIDSIYTEARKPKKPSMVEVLLIALATAAAGAAISIIGQLLTNRIPGMFNLADPEITSNETLKQSLKQARERVNIITRTAFDAFKDGLKSLSTPIIRELILAGKQPVDAFFEGQKKLTVDAGKMAFDKAEEGRTEVHDLAAIHPSLPLITAKNLFSIKDNTFKEIYDVQKRETLNKWLVYLAQSRAGTFTPSPDPWGGDLVGTNMAMFITESSGGFYGFQGVLFIDAALEYKERPVEGAPVLRPMWHIFPLRGYFYGLSKSMLSMLGNTRVRELSLPIVYRIASYPYPSSTREPYVVGGAFSQNHFTLAINESGTKWLSKTTSYQKEQLQAVGGENAVHHILGSNTMIGLRVTADRD